jgi:hypothetical protein
VVNHESAKKPMAEDVVLQISVQRIYIPEHYAHSSVVTHLPIHRHDEFVHEVVFVPGRILAQVTKIERVDTI